MTGREKALIMIKQKGNCVGIQCYGPNNTICFFYDKCKHIKVNDGGLTIEDVRKIKEEDARTFYMENWGEDTLIEDLL